MTEINFIRTTAEPIAHKYTIRIDRTLEEPELFQEELLTIRQAGENDIVHILINSGGGRDDTMKAFLSAIQQSPAHVITEIEGTCCSAATMIFLAGSEFIVSDDAEYMIHTSSFGSAGKENNVRQQVEFLAKSNARLMRKYYKDFLTDVEIEQCIEGKDFWMDADEIMERLENKIKAMQEQDGLSDVEMTRDVMEAMSKEEILDLLFGEQDSDEAIINGDISVLEELSFMYLEKDILGMKETANNLKIKYPHNIGIDKLYEKILAHLENM